MQGASTGVKDSTVTWNSSGRNADVVGAFNDYKDFVLRIATVYAGTRLVEAVDLNELDTSFELAISDDFDRRMTTIRTVGDLQSSIKSGAYGQLALGLATIQLCTAFEILFDRIADIYGVSVGRGDAFEVNWRPIGGAPAQRFTVGNKALMQIRKLHRQTGVDCSLNSDDVLIRLAAIIEARNCFTHAGGVVQTTKVKDRLWVYRIASEVGQPLQLKGNHLDDFLHYMAINALAFVNRAP